MRETGKPTCGVMKKLYITLSETGGFSRMAVDDGRLRTGGRGGGCGLGGPAVAYDAVIEKLYTQ